LALFVVLDLQWRTARTLMQYASTRARSRSSGHGFSIVERDAEAHLLVVVTMCEVSEWRNARSK
jgi:hypothetical protein